MLEMAGWREGAGDREQHHLLAGENVGRAQFFYAFGPEHAEGSFGQAVSSTDTHGYLRETFRLNFAGTIPA
jgi:hypothetical protein